MSSHAPVLSTPQDESTFTYAKVNKAEIRREYLRLTEGDDYISQLHEYYSLDKLALLLGETETNNDGETVKKYKRVTLQFPDQLLCDSATIVLELQKKLGLTSRYTPLGVDADDIFFREKDSDSHCDSGLLSNCLAAKCCVSQSKNQPQTLWILADTSYSACCVDEVAAQHVNADLVVHFGDSCLNPVANLPTAYVFGKPQLDIDHLADEFKARYPWNSFSTQKIVLMADAPHTFLLKTLSEKLSEYQVILTDLALADSSSHIIEYTPQLDGPMDLKTLGRVFRGLAAGEENDDSVLGECELFHVVLPEAPRLLQLISKFRSVTTFHDNQTSQGPYPNLMRRYRYMHMARCAGTIGILVNTLSLANTKLLVQKLARKIKDAGKKHYIFVVGKPNVAKLANFEAVDMWCILGCDHQGIILDQTNEYVKPMVTPYELILAIGDDFRWTGKWVTDFRDVLTEIGEESARDGKAKERMHLQDQESDEEPEFNPVTGQYTSAAKPLRRLQHLCVTLTENEEKDTIEDSNGDSSQALVKKLSGAVALRATVSTSAAHLQTRQWTGLGSDWTDDVDADGATVEEGTAGIARGYGFDVANQNA